ncbi:MAG: hypothetical protein JWO36_6415 [Myxococcales bacterium]|nr:hypothetical protein [Myxococcales bacterium]
MKRLALALLVMLGTGVARAQPQRLDPGEIPEAQKPPEVVLLTFGVGDRIFEKFGHTALCLNYEGADPVCFNYGVTNFNAGSELVWNFVRSKQKFWVDPESWEAMTHFYKWEDRDIWVQNLPLTSEQATKVERKLISDIQEANRYYVYDHFYDNCTTRLRDIIDDATGGKLREGSDAPYPLTFREVGLRGLAEFPPLVALTDFIIGRALDKTPTIWEAMFHPTVLREQVELKLGVKPKLLYKRHGPDFPTEGATDRILAIVLALVFALPLLVATWRRKLQGLALAWATLYLTFWGVLIWALVLLSSIPAIRWNEAVFVLMPFDLALPFLSPTRRTLYARGRVVVLLLVSLLCAIGIFRQPLWVPILTAIMPLAIIAFDLPHALFKRRNAS